MVLFGQNCCICSKVVVFGLLKVVVFKQNCLYSGKVAVFEQKWFYSVKIVVFGQSGGIRAKAVVFGEKL